MNNIDLVQSCINSYIDQIDNKLIKDLYKKIPSGKKLRSKLILKISPKNREAIKLCAIIELIHAASLLHDDVIDEAHTRRGQASINNTFGNKTAIMLGDILYSKAFYELTNFPSQISSMISNAVVLLSTGELQDVELCKSFNTNQQKYFDMIYNKTASLIQTSCVSAALLENKKDIENYALYGKNLGIAFQIVDDILDITQDSVTLGKPAFNDFKEGKVTLPYIYAYERLEDKDQKTLLSLYKKDLNQEEHTWIMQKLNSTDSICDSIKYAKNLANQAACCVQNEDLKHIITQITDRNF